MLAILYLNKSSRSSWYPLLLLLDYLVLIVTGLRGGYVVPYDSPFTTSVAATVFFFSLT